MREYRAKRKDNGEWVFGVPFDAEDSTVIITDIFPFEMYGAENKRCATCVPVDPATVGQYTGLTDKNGKKIWESDILFNNHPSVQKAYSVIWFDGSFVRRTVDGHYLSLNVLYADEFEVIGNTIDNPELLQN